MATLPLISYMREVLDEHTIPLEDLGGNIIEAAWLVKMLNSVEDVYRNNGSL